MNKVFKISNKILVITFILVITLGVSSCSSYGSISGYENDGVYYNPRTDYVHGNHVDLQEVGDDNSGEIKVGGVYFDAEGNGAEQYFYDNNLDGTSGSLNSLGTNNYSLGGNSYFDKSKYSTSLYGYNTSILSRTKSGLVWGRNDGVEVNIWNNYSPWGWNSLYSPFYNGSFGLSLGFGWNNWYGPSYYGSWNNWYGPSYYGSWNNWYGPSYYGGWNNWYGSSYYGGWNNWYGPSYYGGWNNRYRSRNYGTPNRPGGMPTNSYKPPRTYELSNNRYNNGEGRRESITRDQFNDAMNTRRTRETRNYNNGEGRRESITRDQFNDAMNTRRTRETRNYNNGEGRRESITRDQFNDAMNTRRTRETRNYNNGEGRRESITRDQFNDRSRQVRQPDRQRLYNNTERTERRIYRNEREYNNTPRVERRTYQESYNRGMGSSGSFNGDRSSSRSSGSVGGFGSGAGGGRR